MTEADRELGRAITAFEQAAQIGQSDAEVYESLAEAWVQRTAVAQIRQKASGMPTRPRCGPQIGSPPLTRAASPAT